jgi:hypothetical protein
MQSRLGLQELAQQITFSVYGLTGNPFRLQLSSIGKASEGGNSGGQQRLTAVTLGFLAERDTGHAIVVHLHSHNGHHEKTRTNIMRVLQLPSHHPASMDYRTLRIFRFDEEQKQRLQQPTVVTEQIIVAEQPFSTEIHYWGNPPQPAWFLLVNQDDIIAGQLLGLSLSELHLLLHNLSPINNRQDIINQYQRELDDYLRHLKQLH